MNLRSAYACAVHRSKRLVLALALITSACGETQPELREWQPSDHHTANAASPSDRRAAPPEDSAEDPEQTEIRAATALFQTMCASCHGASGRGDGPGRPPAASIADFSATSFQSSRSDDDLASIIRDGRGGFMPAFGDQLSPTGVLALVRHVRRLGTPAAASGAPEPISPGAEVEEAE